MPRHFAPPFILIPGSSPGQVCTAPPVRNVYVGGRLGERGVAGVSASVRVLQSAAWGVAGCGAYHAGQCVAWEPVVRNGMSLCRLHSAAFDRLLVGVHPDYVIHVRPDILYEIDGPMLMHELQGLQGQRILVPSRRVDRPDVERLGEG